MFLLGPAYWLAIVAFLQVWVVRLCARNQALKPWTLYVQFAAMVWCMMAVVKRLYLDEIFPPADALYHEEVARDVAARLGAYRFSEAFEFFGLGNPGYRFLLGVFYSLTMAPEWVVYTINGALGFWGLLALLELLCLNSNCRRMSAILLLGFLYLPSGLQWTTANLKEGPILWGACMMLYWTVPKVHGRALPRGCPILGMLVLGFLRPHIAVIWMLSINLMSTLRSKRYGLFMMTGGGALAGVLLLQVLAPDLFRAATSGGISSSLGERYEQLSGNDRLMSSHFVGKQPVPVWTGLMLILFRPWPDELGSASELLAGFEVWVMALIGLWGWYRHGRLRLTTHTSVLVMFCGLLFFSFLFSYMYNMGLVVRQRLMAFPAVLYLYGWPYVNAQRAVVRTRKRIARVRRRRTEVRPVRSPGGSLVGTRNQRGIA